MQLGRLARKFLFKNKRLFKQDFKVNPSRFLITLFFYKNFMFQRAIKLEIEEFILKKLKKLEDIDQSKSPKVEVIWHKF